MTIYDTHSDAVAEYDSVLGKLDKTDDRMPALALAKRLIRIAEHLVEAAPSDADAHQMLGLAWYHFPRSTSWRSAHCRAALAKALSLDPTHPWARKFLGYLLFDQEHYAEALHHFDRLDRDFFDDPVREWELLKILELRQVCQLRLSSSTLPDDFASFRSSYIEARNHEDEAFDLGSTVPLQELPECAELLLEQGADASSAPLRELLSFLSLFRSEVSFWNRALESRLSSAEATPSNPQTWDQSK